ncbi:hypothetical protein PR048_009740 [Dryococelus australis]|uniref:Uncharacterized protein n=1 Tax=Dryococelus australis TaxID=614101 RepID=A0ABQ9I0S3_9NEOP|nr:hypothetical protein PR048_009740 [Dryococelus australis]
MARGAAAGAEKARTCPRQVFLNNSVGENSSAHSHDRSFSCEQLLRSSVAGSAGRGPCLPSQDYRALGKTLESLPYHTQSRTRARRSGVGQPARPGDRCCHCTAVHARVDGGLHPRASRVELPAPRAPLARPGPLPRRYSHAVPFSDSLGEALGLVSDLILRVSKGSTTAGCRLTSVLEKLSGETYVTLYIVVLKANEGRGKREISAKTRRPAASSGTISTCENQGITPPEIEPDGRTNRAAKDVVLFMTVLLFETVYIDKVLKNGTTPQTKCEVDRILSSVHVLDIDLHIFSTAVCYMVKKPVKEIEVGMEQCRNEGRGNGRSARKPADQRHR